MSRKRNRKQNAGDNEMLMRVVSSIGLMGMLAVLIAIGIMACLAFGSDASADEQMTKASHATSAPSGKKANRGEVSFDADGIKVHLEVGMGNGTVASNGYVPAHLTLQNGGEDFEGHFRIFPGSNAGNSLMYEKKVSIAAGETKNIDMLFSIPTNASSITAALCEEDGDVIKAN